MTTPTIKTLFAREAYTLAYKELRTERRYYREDDKCYGFDFYTVVQFRLDEKTIDPIQYAAHVTLASRWSDDLEDRENAQRNQLGNGATFVSYWRNPRTNQPEAVFNVSFKFGK